MENDNYTTAKSTVGGQQEKGSLSQQANEAKETVKHTVAETTATVKQQGRQAVNEAQQAASELAAEAKHTATEKLGEAKHRAESMVDERKNQTAERLQGIAGALRETSTKLQDQQEDTFANYAATAADQVDKFSGYLRNQNVGDLLHDVDSLARRQPELFLAGALAAGFLLGRFFKSSAANQANQVQRYGYYPRYGQSADNMYGTSPQQSQYGAPGYGNAYDTASYNPSYGAQQGQYSQQDQYSDTGTGRHSTSQFEGRQGTYDPQSGRPNQGEGASSTESSGQQTSGLGTSSASNDQNATQNRSGQSRFDQQRAEQNMGNRSTTGAQTASSGAGNVENKGK